jgi:hypothetical protein
MLIEKIKTKQLIPAEYNPRKDLKPGDPEYEKLKRSLEEFGYVEPVIWNKTTGRVIGGHQRLKILLSMGMEEIECVVVEMDEQKEKALNIALNKISGDWDKDKLALLITDLNASDFDVSLTGFDPGELDDLFKDSLKDNIKEDDFDVDSELKKPAVSHLGDIWLLGQHRLVCGDSTKKDTFDVLMDGKTANLVVTDPPSERYLYTCSGSPAIASASILTQAYTAVACIAVRSFTVLPDDVPPNRKENALPTRFCGLSLERNSPFNKFIGLTSKLKELHHKQSLKFIELLNLSRHTPSLHYYLVHSGWRGRVP